MTTSSSSSLYVKETQAISRTKGALLIAESIPDIKFGEIVDVILSNGETKRGQAIDISNRFQFGSNRRNLNSMISQRF